MPYVTPGDPNNSYLVRKLEGTLGDLETQCAAVNMDPIVANSSDPTPLQPCGVQMPLNSNPDQAFNMKVRNWVMQGAPYN